MFHKRYRMENKHEKIPNFLEVNIFIKRISHSTPKHKLIYI